MKTPSLMSALGGKKIWFALPVLFLLAAGCNSSQPAQNSQAGNAPQSSATKLVDEPYYSFAYEIDPNALTNLSDQMKQVLSGFKVTAVKNADGTTAVSLKSTNTEYHDQTYTLKPGQKLYFIEKSLGDDKNDTEKFLGDDTAVVVDQNGYVVQ